MANRKNCINCGRGIDEFARVCPYCSWSQSQPVPAQPLAAPVEPIVQNDPRRLYGVLGGIAFVLSLIVVFAVGAFFHGSRPAKAAQQSASAATQPSSSRVSVTLIPVTEGMPPPAADTPITAIPPQGTTAAPGPSDLTALPSDQYAAAAARLHASQQQATGSVVDPRSITGSPYKAPAPRPSSHPRAVASVETQPVPVFQPVPHVRVDREATAQLGLLVGTDGRVHDIDIQRAVPAVMGPLIGTVQQWRFRPATQNGEPVSSRFTVAVTFRP